MLLGTNWTLRVMTKNGLFPNDNLMKTFSDFSWKDLTNCRIVDFTRCGGYLESTVCSILGFPCDFCSEKCLSTFQTETLFLMIDAHLCVGEWREKSTEVFIPPSSASQVCVCVCKGQKSNYEDGRWLVQFIQTRIHSTAYNTNLGFRNETE